MITEYEEIEISAWRQRGLEIIPIQAVSLKMDLVIVFIKQKKGRKNIKKTCNIIISIFLLCTDFASPYFVFSLYQKFLLCCGSDFDFNEV